MAPLHRRPHPRGTSCTASRSVTRNLLTSFSCKVVANIHYPQPSPQIPTESDYAKHHPDPPKSHRILVSTTWLYQICTLLSTTRTVSGPWRRRNMRAEPSLSYPDISPSQIRRVYIEPWLKKVTLHVLQTRA
ncbi:hypothetical protein BS50DRAFT_74789 [Corynespora cassiicola Philippines]|uniref:Uncharacterized protein n=1 Tax=Corynespora cassiicola Philippines TaxID=1448308 RepID=A0A2T2NHF7_CORCC|nr:hypothetical protein BS50DRAFT_74789 [Corynespora cassiicola Philippines]